MAGIIFHKKCLMFSPKYFCYKLTNLDEHICYKANQPLSSSDMPQLLHHLKMSLHFWSYTAVATPHVSKINKTLGKFCRSLFAYFPSVKRSSNQLESSNHFVANILGLTNILGDSLNKVSSPFHFSKLHSLAFHILSCAILYDVSYQESSCMSYGHNYLAY